MVSSVKRDKGKQLDATTEAIMFCNVWLLVENTTHLFFSFARTQFISSRHSLKITRAIVKPAIKHVSHGSVDVYVGQSRFKCAARQTDGW